MMTIIIIIAAVVSCILCQPGRRLLRNAGLHEVPLASGHFGPIVWSVQLASLRDEAALFSRLISLQTPSLCILTNSLEWAL